MNLKKVLELLESDKAPEGLTLRVCLIRVEAVRELADALAKAPKGLTLDLRYNAIRDAGARYLAHVLGLGKVPEGLTLKLESNRISDADANAFADALKSGNVPKGLTLDLRYNPISNVGAKVLADALGLGKAPEGLTLNFKFTNIDHTGVKHFADALKKSPKGLTLGFQCNPIGDAGAIFLAEALGLGKAPEGLTLNLQSTQISPKGIKAFVDALKSGKFPKGLTLNFRDNPVSDADAIDLAEACAYQNHFNHKQITLIGIEQSILDEAKKKLIIKIQTVSLSIKHQPQGTLSPEGKAILCHYLLPRIIFFAIHLEQTEFDQPTKSQKALKSNSRFSLPASNTLSPATLKRPNDGDIDEQKDYKILKK
ncbi:hypothetical protein ACNVED_05620 [Legionella sp. D16C41]|uniref:hypothetical protein n=1 Tax=Legionella sp. D16C41 TaxID=3402688 RepID=UPI003AF61CE5